MTRRLGAAVAAILFAVLAAWLFWPRGARRPIEVVPASPEATRTSPPATSEPAPPAVAAGSRLEEAPAVAALEPDAKYALVNVQVLDDDGDAVHGVDADIGAHSPELYDAVLEDPNCVRKGVTDERGRIRFRVLPGEYVVIVNREDSRPDLSRGLADVTADPLEPKSVDVRLESLSCSLSVRVVDDLGVPVEGVAVRASRGPSPVETAADGYARFERLPAGQIHVRLEALAKRPPRVAIPYSAQETCELARGEPGSLLFVLERTGGLRIHLLGAADSPPGTIAIYKDREDPSFNVQVTRPIPRAGHLEEAALPPGKYTIVVRVDAASDLQSAGPAEALVMPGQIANVSIELEQFPGVVSGSVRDSAGNPIERAIVDASPLPPESRHGKSVSTRPDGTFEVRGLPLEPLWITVYPPAIRMGKGHYAHHGTAEEPALLLAGPTTGLDLRLSRGFTIQGVLRDRTTHEPVGSAAITIDHARKLSLTERAYTADDSDLAANGRFAFHHLRPGSYRVWPGEKDRPLGAALDVEVGRTPDAPELTDVTLWLDGR
jgi:protocatechuate 3,4-dioxygenase beta subunit